MVHGLLWLPLLVFFIWITWAGWNEYQKVETYQQWASQFERAKYDIYAALGQTGQTLTWGLPTRQGIIDAQSIQLNHVRSVELFNKDEDAFKQAVTGSAKKSEAVIQLTLDDGNRPQIPFTDADVAQQWHRFLTQTVAAIEA